MSERSPEVPVRVAMIGLSVLWVVLLVGVVASRLTFPLELEWMEGGSMIQALRAQRGAPLYPAPSADGIPHLYTPLYGVVVGVLGLVFPLGLALGRLVSVLAMVATAVAIYRVVAFEGGPRAHRWLGIGLYLSSYVFAYRWYDVARADSMCMALVLWSLAILRRSWGDSRRAAVAGVLMGLAFWTKQTAFVFVVGSGLAALLVAPRQLWADAGTIAVLGLGGVAVGQAMSDGWMWTYIFELHQEHPFNDERFVRKAWLMMLHAWPFAAACLLYIVGQLAWPRLRRTRRVDQREDAFMRARWASRRGVGFWAVNTAAAMIASALGYATLWAEANAFVPAAIFVAVLVAVAIPTEGRASWIAGGLACAQLVFALVIEPRFKPIQDEGVQALSRSYVLQSVSRSVPSATQREASRNVRAMLAESDGPVFALMRPWWGVLASGGEVTAHAGSMGLKDVVAEDRRRIERALAERVRDGGYAQIWTEGPPPPWLRRAMIGRYGLAQRLHGEERARPMTGWMSEAGTLTPYTRDQLMFEPIHGTRVSRGVAVVSDFESGTRSGTRTGGTAFGSGPVRSISGKLPPVGPVWRWV